MKKNKTKINEKAKYGVCALCTKERELKLSHRIPKAIGAIIKKDSFTKRLRSVHDPDTPLQDLDKEYMLCGECEQRFSTRETLFIQKVLRPFRNKRNTKLEYDYWLYYFIVSLSWRSLYHDSLDEKKFLENGFTKKQFDKLKLTESRMREYLLGNSKGVLYIENHLIFLDECTDIKGYGVIPYSRFCNAAFGYVFGNNTSGTLYVFHILAGILVITVIQKDSTDKYKNTYVKNGKGKFNKEQNVKSKVIDSEVLGYVPGQLEQARIKFSEKEKSKLLKKIEKNPDGFLKSSSSIRYREE